MINIVINNIFRLHDNEALYEASLCPLPLVVGVCLPQVIKTVADLWQLRSIDSFVNDLKQRGVTVVQIKGTAKDLENNLLQQAQQKGLTIRTIFSNPDTQNLIHTGYVTDQYKSYNSFWRHCLAKIPFIPYSLPAPEFTVVHALADEYKTFQSDIIPHHDDCFNHEELAQKKWQNFKASILQGYIQQRDYINSYNTTTSQLSQHINRGEISIKNIWHDLIGQQHDASVSKFLGEIGWREFAYHLAQYYPNLRCEPMRPSHRSPPWSENKEHLVAWQQGRTGVPIIDAAMRELIATGNMHNRLRMLTACFLVKFLLIPWQIGEEFFFEKLADADPAINGMNWQWIAGCGVENMPFFQVFNPIVQAKKFDHDGQYVRQWLPEIKHLSAQFIHEPWLVRDHASLNDYPKQPIVDLVSARNRAIQIWRDLMCKNP